MHVCGYTDLDVCSHVFRNSVQIATQRHKQSGMSLQLFKKKKKRDKAKPYYPPAKMIIIMLEL